MGFARGYPFYKPQADGSLKGNRHTDIACRGSVVMPVAAVPA